MIRCQICMLRCHEHELRKIYIKSLEKHVLFCIYCLGDLKALSDDGLLFVGVTL